MYFCIFITHSKWKQPAIWLPKMEYFPLTSHFSDCFSRRNFASTAYNYYSQLTYYSKTFSPGCGSDTSILKTTSGRLWQSMLTLLVKPCKTIYLVFTSQTSWYLTETQLTHPLLDFETCCFLVTLSIRFLLFKMW